MQLFKGTGVALVTPFKSDYSVDVEALQKLVKYVVDGGVEYIVVLGTTAESVTLSKDDKELVKNTIIDANNGKLPLMLGIGGNCTQAVINELKTVDLTGFDAILSVSPYYNKPSQEGIYQHFKAIAENSSLPIVLYNVPGRTSSNILPSTILRLAKDFDNIIGVKEASGDITQAMKIIQEKSEDFLVISGDDMLALPIALAGGSGVISVIGQAFPKEFSEMIRMGLDRKVDKAFDIHYRFADSIDMIFEQGNPAGIKEMLKGLNIIDNTLRLPLVKVDSVLSQKINSFIKKIK